MRHLKIYFLLALLLMVGEIIQAQDIKEYHPLIPESGEKQWDMRFDYYYGDSQYEIAKLGDVIEYEGQIYRELTIKYDDLNYTVPFGLFREQDKKVYVRHYSTAVPHITDEELYYDFNLQVGDLFEVSHEDEPEYIQLMAIEEVVLENGSLRNKYVFNIGWDDDPEVWIEGIGSLAGINWRFIPGWFASGFSHLQCYFEDDDLVWTGGECWDDVEEVGPSTPSTSSGTEGSGALILFPNPSSEKVQIEGIEVAEVQVFNSLGQLLQTIKGTNVINVSDLPKGISMLHITDACGNKQWAKVVVK